MAITVVLVINRSGGLIYHRDFADRARLSSNEYLILAGTLHVPQDSHRASIFSLRKSRP